ncbi:hypothetical protein [Stakelama pacifica]|uniref:Uncharacterized protein n=1 Tax=Stakelama pacifica TaxID=517720 RepID=A0A4R6FLE0_9SPHN|nr:hypothetical protein [Stakelama pacifica]TDN81740.1 hypothetical protein EV664_107142 [Stakelama pacifica]GGO96424.1 hypothetical protein GCM10011329_22920 [Stakelama pacifica]
MSGAKHTPGPWFPHGFTYPEGVAGDVFAKDSNNVLACTAICRVVEPISKMDSDLRRPPLDALQAVARKNAAQPVIEANARLIAAAPDGLEIAEEFLAFARSGANFYYPPGSLQKLEAFVAKARGEA